MPPKRRFITCEICGNRASRSDNEKRMFMARFPLDEARCKQWVKFVGKEDLIYVPIEKLHTLKYVCGNHFDNRAFNKAKNRLKNWAIPSKNLKNNPFPDEILLEFPCHIYSNIDVTMSNTSQGINDNEASLFQAGPNNSDSCTARQQLLAQELNDKKEIQSGKRKLSPSSEPSNSGLQLFDHDYCKKKEIMLSHKRQKISCSEGSLHLFPNPTKFPERFKAWVRVVTGKDECDFDYTKKRICDRHFIERDRNRNNRLNALAVPSLFLWGPNTPMTAAAKTDAASTEDVGNQSVMTDEADGFSGSELEVEYLEEDLDLDVNMETEKAPPQDSQGETMAQKTTEVKKFSHIITMDGEKRLADSLTPSIGVPIDYQPLKRVVCVACFSMNRVLVPVMETAHYWMVKLLCSEFKFSKYDRICWECESVFHKLYKFKKKAIAAQALFKDVTEGNKKFTLTKPLSNLATTDIVHLSISESVAMNADECVDDDARAPSSPDESVPSPEGATTVTAGDTTKEKIAGPNYFKHKYNIIKLSDIKDKVPERYKEGLEEVCKRVTLTDDELEVFRDSKRTQEFRKYLNRCDDCILRFASHEQLVEHNRKHSLEAGPFECKVCKLRFSTNEACARHCDSHYLVFECASCGHRTHGRACALRHFERHRRCCRDCGLMLPSLSEFRQHRLRAHGPKLTCEYCQKIFRVKYNYKKHVLNHLRKGLRERRCGLCDRGFVLGAALDDHLARVHGVKKGDNYCELCKTQYCTWASYKNHFVTLKHMKLANQSIKDMIICRRQCEECGRFFPNLRQLKVHRRFYHTYEKSYCNLCQKEYPSKALLDAHVRNSNRHKSQQERNKTCEICGKSFFNISCLRQHLYTHKVSADFKCYWCDAAFTNPKSLNKHQRRVHNRQAGTQFSRMISDPELVGPTEKLTGQPSEI